MSEKKIGIDLQHSEHLPDSGHVRNADAGNLLVNPLAHLSKEKLLADVDRFTTEHGLTEHTDVFRRGALIAQRPHDFEDIPELNEDDLVWLRKSAASKWAQPRLMYFAVIVCAIGAATQGWDQTGSNGANLSFPQEFGIAIPYDQPGGQLDEWRVGFVNAAPYISAAGLGCWLSDPLNNWFGRRGEIFITSIILIVTPIASGFTQTWQGLAAVRLVLGIGMGAKAATVPMYAAELAPANIRGALVMGWQLWTAFGIFLGFCANTIVKDVGSIAWRLQLGSAFIPALPLAILIYFCPESPRWLMKKGRFPQAFQAFKKLRYGEVEAARDMYYAYVQLEEEAKIVQGKTYISRFTELFTIPRVRRGTIAASTVMLAQQMCGINIIAFYSSTIFVESGYSVDQALYASLGFGAVNFVFAFPAVFTIDTFGRRSLLLATFPNMAWTLFVCGAMFYIPHTDSNTALRTGLIALFIYLFAAFYSVGEGPVPFMYSAEVFPLAQREQGMAWAVCVCLGFSSILSLTFPSLLRAFGQGGAFFFYGGLNLLAFVMIFFLVPETKQLTLEELDQVFSTPVPTFARYQIGTVAPHWFRRWFLFKKNEPLRPMGFREQQSTKA